MNRLLFILLGAVLLVGIGCTPKTPEPPAKTPPPEAPGSVPLPTRVQPLRDLPMETEIADMADEERAAMLTEYMQDHDMISAPAIAPSAPEGASLKSGAFQMRYHSVSGGAAIIKEGDRYKLVLSSDFVTDAGPDLRVVATSHNRPWTSEDLHQEPYAELGPLQGTSGAQVYDLGPLNPDDVKSVAIYCKPFQVVFGWATLE